MNDTTSEETVTDEKLKLTRAEAVEWIRKAKRGVHFSAHISMKHALLGDDEHEYPTGARLSVELTRATALKMVRDYMSDWAESDGRRIPCSVYTAYRVGRPVYVAYWIG
jgi:hypothetical protein